MALTQAALNVLDAHFDALEAQADADAATQARTDVRMLCEYLKAAERRVITAAGQGDHAEDTERADWRTLLDAAHS